MAFLTGSIEFKVYTDSAETEFPKELVPYIKQDFENVDVDEVQISSFGLAASASQTLNFNGVGTVKKVYLYSSQTDLNVNWNSLGNLTYKSGFPGLMPLEISSMVIANASSDTATAVTVAIITG